MYNAEEKNESTERTITFFRFEDLRIYHKSLDYINWLHDVSMLFPENDTTGVVSRLNTSARNICFYITEGSARNKTQFVHYLKLAKTAIRECLVLTTISYRAGYLTDTYEQESRQFLMELTKMSGALISSLQRSANNTTGSYNGNYNGNGNSSNANSSNVNYNANGNSNGNSYEDDGNVQSENYNQSYPESV
jgi:four helix bundle protein